MADFEGQSFDDLPTDTPTVQQQAISQSTQPQTDHSGMDFDDLADDSEKYSTPLQQIKTVGEGLGKGFAGPAFTALEKGLGVKSEDIKARQEANPILHGASEIGGLGAGFLTGTGEAAVMGKAGELAQAAVGLNDLAKGASFSAKIGSSAIQQAAEMAVLQSGDETSKMILQDPGVSAESAIANIGLAAALGGAGGAFMTGVASPLWKATVGDRLDGALTKLTSQLGGVEGGSRASADLAARAGLEIPEVLAAKIDGAPGADELFSKLSQTDTTAAGRSVQKTLGEFNDQVGSKMVETLGHEPSYIDKLPDLDKYSTGQKLADTLHDDLLNNEIKPVVSEYDKINEQFRGSPLSEANIRTAMDGIAQKAIDQGWHKAESEAQTRLMERVMEKLPKQETAEDLKKFITNLRESNPFGSDTYSAAKDIAKVLGDAQGRAVTEGILAKGGEDVAAKEALTSYEGLKGKYAGLMDKLENLNEHLHVGRYDGPKSFLSALKDLGSSSGEAVLNRLSGANKAQVLEALAQVSPKTLSEVRQFHVNKLLDASLDAHGQMSPNRLMKAYDKLSPQLKSLVTPEAAQGRLEALHEISGKLIDPNHNFSNTARTADKLHVGDAMTPLSMIAMGLGHGGAGIFGMLANAGLKEGTDALRLGMMKFLGSNQPVKAEGFKAMVEFLHNTIKGESFLAKAVTNVLKSGAQVLTSDQMPAKADLEKLDKTITKLQQAPGILPDKLNASPVGHYLPDHQMHLSQTSAAAAQYLASIKPHPQKLSPLGKEVPPSSSEVARYNRALSIAQQPAVVLQHVKQGTIQASDIQDLNALYPGLYKKMSTQLSNEMNKMSADHEPISYKTRMGMSLFLGTPLDTSMQPSTIQSTQQTYAPKTPPQPQGKAPSKGKPSALGKTSKAYMTPGQAAESDRSGRE